MANTVVVSAASPVLGETERSRLEILEGSISTNLRAFYEVGMALLEIRESKLYRETHGTFEAYCRDRWDIGVRQAQRKMVAARVVENLKTRHACRVLPTIEAQALPLGRLSADDQRKAWQESIATAPGGKITAWHVEAVVRRHMGHNGKGPQFSSLIKPSDNWNFSRVRYNRVDETAGHGYIPGDLYANCFWYYVQPSDLVVDPMAAAGMAKVVYDDRANWMGEYAFDFDLLLFDLTPQAPDVTQHDLLTGFPVAEADYIIIDPPYYGIVKGQYSDAPNDLANMSLDDWTAAIHTIAGHCAVAQRPDVLCTVISPNFRNIREQQIFLATEVVRCAWESAGYELYDKAYASRRIQQKQGTRMAAVNNAAKASRVMLADMAEVLTFRRCGSHTRAMS